MLEECTDGYPHFHLLLRCGFIDRNKIVAIWRRLTEAYIVDIRVAHGGSVAYVAKYINKARDHTGQFSRQRISVSRGFWQHEPQETLAITQTSREHPIPYANCNLTNRAITRQSVGYYHLDEREPGDEWPSEFFPERDACENRKACAASGQLPEGLSTTPPLARPAADHESFAIPAS
jgi:hypothetical protein